MCIRDSLYAMIRVGGHTGYAFFYDNNGVMRYEMVLEGYGLDRILWYEGNMTVCASAYKIAQINRLGQVTAVYDTEGFELHHDMVLQGDEGKIVALASDESDEVNLEDMAIEVDLETGEVKELLDFKEIFSDYYENDASELTATDEFFWLAGQKDWIHLNTVQYLPEDDSVIVSSRETSTIIKIKNVHSGPEIDYLIGDEDFWKGTPYEEYSYTPVSYTHLDVYKRQALNELQMLYNGKSLVEDGQFALEVMEYINSRVNEFKEEDGHLYAIYGTPAENLCGLQVKQFRNKYGIIEGVSDREYVSNSFHCHVTEDITPIEKQDKEGRFWNLCNGGKIQYVKYPIDYNLEAVKTLIRRAMDKGYYEGVNLSLAYCDDCGHQELEMDVCPKCGSRNLTKIDRMNGYLSYSRVHGDTRLNDAKMAEIAERKSM